MKSNKDINDYFNQVSIFELRDLAKLLDITSPTAYSKAELIKKIEDTLLTEKCGNPLFNLVKFLME